MNRILVLLLRLVLALPAQALDLQGLYAQALTASRQGGISRRRCPCGIGFLSRPQRMRLL